MIRSSTQLKAKVRNLSAGNNDQAKMLIRSFIMERFDSILDEVRLDETMKDNWNKYRNENFFVGDLSWDDVNNSVKKLKETILG